MTPAGLEALRAAVHDEPELARALFAVEPDRFAAEVARVAAERGCEVSAEELAAAAAEGRRAWVLRWIV